MSGSPDTRASESLSAKEKTGLQRYNSALEKLHLAEAELARVRGDLAKKGIRFAAANEMHW